MVKSGPLKTTEGITADYIGELKIGGNYHVNRYLETGAYLGYATHRTHITYHQVYGYENYSVYLYGMNANFQILPLMVASDNLKLNTYITGKLGGYHISTLKRNGMTINLGLGISYLVFKHFGLFAEYGYGIGEEKYRDFNYEDEKNIKKHISSFRFGIVAKF